MRNTVQHSYLDFYFRCPIIRSNTVEPWLKMFLSFQIILLLLSGVLFWQTYARFNHDPEFYYVHQVLGVSWCSFFFSCIYGKLP